MAESAAKKMGIKAGARAFFAGAPAAVVKAMDLPDLETAAKLEGDFDYIHFFVKSQEEFDDVFPKLKSHLRAAGALWVSWQKNKRAENGLTLTKIIELGYNHGLVESKTISLDAVWSAIKFTHPKKGKIYKNSYGRLKSESA